MSLTKINEYRVDCDSCDECEWVNAKNKKDANEEIEKKNWEVDKKHICPSCINKRAKKLLARGL